MVRIRRALVSVSDKRGLAELGAALARHGVAILSTGGTAAALRRAGIEVTEVAAFTGAPEILDGRVKTLHPRIHGGLLGRATAEHREEMARHQIEAIDLVVVNLYPFAATAARPGVSRDEIIEQIDIGGPSMIRSAAKNHERVAVVVDPADYPALIAELDHHDGAVGEATRRRLARLAFAHTAAYDGAIANHLGAEEEGGNGRELPTVLTLQWDRGRGLRYGENPHQAAAFYRTPGSSGPSLAEAEVHQGKELSYNNLLDLDAALALVIDLPATAAVIVKHGNPCGASSSASLLSAYREAREADPVSAFGGVVALNGPVDEAVAEALGETFLECVIAPAFSDGALALLSGKKNLRLLTTAMGGGLPGGLLLRSVLGGLLVQRRDDRLLPAAEARPATRRPPSPEELVALDFAWRVAKHVKSNAIVLARGTTTVGVGAGQMSRLDSVRVAVEKAGPRAAGAVLASDAFFPFRDGLDAGAAAGVTAVIQPGGSVRDGEVVAAADEHGLAMVLTGMRHFRH